MGFTIAQLLGHQAKVFSQFPTETVTISGTDYDALVLNRTEGNDYGIGGKSDTAVIRMAIERSTISGAIPTQGTQATFDSATYRIAEVEEDDAASSVYITLEPLDK